MDLDVQSIPVNGALETSIEGGANRPLALDRGHGSYRLTQGFADVFILDQESDARHHLFRLECGATLFSTPAHGPGKLVAIGSLGSRFERIRQDEAFKNANAIADWVRELHAAVSDNHQWPNHLLNTGTLTLEAGETCSSAAGNYHLVQADAPGLSWNGIALEAGRLFPLSAPGLLAAAQVCRMSIITTPNTDETAAALAQLAEMIVQWGLRRFQAEQSARRERQQLRESASHQQFSNALAALSRARNDQKIWDNPWIAAIEAALEAFGHKTDHLPDILRRKAADTKTFEPILNDLLLDYRPVRLRAGWWKRDGLPLLGETTDGAPVALVPTGSGNFKVIGELGTKTVDAVIAATIRPSALQLYPMLDDRKLGLRDLVQFAARGLGPDVRRIVATSVLAAAAMALFPVATGVLFDSVVPVNDRSGLLQITLLLVATALGQSIFELTRAMTILRMEAVLDAKLQAALVLRLFRLPVSFFQRFAVGDLGQRTLGLQEVRQILTASTLGSLLGLIGGVTGIVTMAFISWRLTLFAMIPFTIIVLVSGWISRQQLRHERDRFERRGGSFLLQVLVGLPKLRAAAAEMRAFSEWIWRTMHERKQLGQARRWQGWQTVTVAVLPALSLLFIFGCLLLVLKSETAQAALIALVDTTDASSQAAALSTGMFVAFVTAFGQASTALTTAITAVSEVLTINPLVERVLPLIEEEPEVKRTSEPPGRLSGEIAFNRVHFRYGKDGPLVLKDVSFAIKPGEYIGIVGESGSGKSTLMRLLLGFDVAQEGALFFDGKPADRLDAALLRKEIGVVLQNGRISPGSIYENIAGASGLGLEAAWAAARLVALASDIEAMPMGMHTVLNDGGGALSGGQRQRILLARALVHQPNILLLDEATSALDNRTQRVVTETLGRLSVTRIVVAHRLTTIQDVDRIFVMDKGQLVESGTYNQLMEERGVFYALARRQLLENNT